MTTRERCTQYSDGVVTDNCGVAVSPLDDDYYAYKSELDRLTDPLSDDYSKYDNE